MRELTLEEQELIAGGDTTTDTGGDFDGVVTDGTDYTDYTQPGGDSGDFGDFGDFGNIGGGSGSPDAGSPPASFDIGTHHIDTSELHGSLTQAQQQAIEDFKNSLVKDDAAVHNIADNAVLHLDNGTANGINITGSELKALWNNADFTINDPGHVYANGSNLGESVYNNGDPQVGVNLDELQGYDQAQNGMDFMPLHAVGHVIAEQNGSTSNVTANDIARAIEQYNGNGTYDGAEGGYSPNDPQFH